MNKRLLIPLQKAGSVFSAFSGPQRLIAAIGIAILLLGGTFFYRWAATPTLQPLFSNLAASDASAIVEQLDSQGVEYELADSGGTILVPQSDVYKLRLSMSSQGLPASQDTGYALLDEQGVTSSQFQQQVTWQRALEGELASTVKALDGVESSVVHLAIPKRDVFADGTDKPSASVLVTMRPGQQMPAQQVQSVVHLVASSIEGMDPAEVTVVDGKGQLLSAAGVAAGGGGMASQQTVEYERRVTASLQQVLDRVLGPGNAVATVAADLSFDSVDRTSETFSPAAGTPPLTETENSEKYTGRGGAATGVLGPDNIGAPAANGEGNDYEKTSSSATNAVNKVTEQTTQAAGALSRQSVSVIVDSATAGDVDMLQLKEAVAGAAGIDETRGDSLSVTRMAFDTAAADETEAAMAAAEKAEQQAQLIELARTAGIILAALAICLIALFMTRRKRSLDLVPLEDEPLDELDWVAEDVVEEPAAISATAAPALEAAPDASAARRDEVVTLVDNQPDEVAELLRGWLADRRS